VKINDAIYIVMGLKREKINWERQIAGSRRVSTLFQLDRSSD